MNLSDAQQLFWRAARGEALPEEIEQAFVGTPDFSAPARLELYRAMYVHRQIQALAHVFPRTAELLGRRFQDGARAYIAAHPSRFHALERVGVDFPAFLSERDVDPALVQVARLEWAWTEVLLAPDPDQIADPQRLPRDFASARLRFVPAFRVLRVTERGVALWRHEREDDRSPTHGEWVALWRRDRRVCSRTLEPGERSGLEAAVGGATLAAICEAFLDSSGGSELDEDAAGAWAARWLARWFAQGWLEAVEES